MEVDKKKLKDKIDHAEFIKELKRHREDQDEYESMSTDEKYLRLQKWKKQITYDFSWCTGECKSKHDRALMELEASRIVDKHFAHSLVKTDPQLYTPVLLQHLFYEFQTAHLDKVHYRNKYNETYRRLVQAQRDIELLEKVVQQNEEEIKLLRQFKLKDRPKKKVEPKEDVQTGLRRLSKALNSRKGKKVSNKEFQQ